MKTIERLLEMIQAPETHSVEFKEAVDADDFRAIAVAFANDYDEVGGGTVIIGIRGKDKTVIGLVGDLDKLQRGIADTVRDGSTIPSIAPEIYLVKIDGKAIIVVETQKGARRPYRSKGICYIRVGSTTRKATFQEELELYRRTEYSSFDRHPVVTATEADIDWVKFNQYLKSRITKETLEIDDRTPQDVAEHLRYLVESGGTVKPTAGALLLFGKMPQQWFNNSSIDFVRFDGKSETDDILTRQEIKGTLDEIVYRTQQVVEANMARGSFFTSTSWKRVDIVEYPLRALREALLNAAMHRDYEVGNSKIYVKLFDDRVDITSPGGLFGIVNKHNFGSGITDYRNPILAETLRTLELVEQVGRGIQLIRRTMEENDSPSPDFHLEDTYVKVILHAHPKYSAVRHYEKGIRAREQGATEEARDYFKSAVRVNPQFEEPYFSWATLEADEDNIISARDLFERTLDLAPQHEQAYARWAMMENRLGNLEEARGILSRGTNALPSSSYLWHQRAIIERGQGNFLESRRLYNQAINIKGNDYRVWQSFGQMEYKARNYGASESCLRKALEFVDAEYAKAWVLVDLARTLAAKRAPQLEVLECFKQSLKLNSNHPQTYDSYGRYLKQIGRDREADEMRNKALDLGLLIRRRRPRRY